MTRNTKIAAISALLAVAIILMILFTFLGTARHEPLRTLASTDPSSQPTTQSTATTTTHPDHPYTVTMSPMGSVTFKHVPQRIVTQDANYNDMLVALQQQQHLIATGYANNRYDGFYAELASANTALKEKNLSYLSNGSGSSFDKETLYSLHADVHHIDPLQLARSRGWTSADVEEIAQNVGPFFANRYSRVDDYPGPEKYEYYSVWELAEKMGEVYRQTHRIAQLKALYDQMLAGIAVKLPPLENRPRVGLAMYSKTGFLPFTIAKGFGTEQYRAVGAVDAFASIPHMAYKDGGAAGGARLDIEGMLTLDPDILITPFGVVPGMRSNHDNLLTLKNDPLGKRLKAIQNNRIYPGGTPLEGPLFLFFQVEMAAKQIYPDRFGEYHDDQKYALNEQLFDRTAVVAILSNPSPGDAP